MLEDAVADLATAIINIIDAKVASDHGPISSEYRADLVRTLMELVWLLK